LQAFAHVDRHLQGRDYLVGERYTIADIYLGMLASWLPRLNSERLAGLHDLQRHQQTFQSRPTTLLALEFETKG
jgi:glutathione S-transferase